MLKLREDLPAQRIEDSDASWNPTPDDSIDVESGGENDVVDMLPPLIGGKQRRHVSRNYS